jgi:hypothetical protein
MGLQFEEKLNLLFENFVEWEGALLTLAQRFSIWPSPNHDDAMDSRLLLDRRLVNLLTACKLYLDQSDHTLSSLFGSGSKQADSINLKRNSFYDAYFGYRFMETIRNHIQHRALPVSEIQFHMSAVDPPNTDRIELFVIPSVFVEDLKQDPKIKRKIIEELEKGPPAVDLRGPAREYVARIADLHDDMRVLIDPVVTAGLSVYKKARQDYSNIEGLNVDHPALMSIDDDVTAHPVDETPLSEGPIDRYGALRSRRTGTKTLDRTFVSNSLRRK